MDIIGFIISLLALVYLFFKQQSVARYRAERAEDLNAEELVDESPLKELQRAIEHEKAAREASRKLPPPPKVVKTPKKPDEYRSLEDYRLVSQIEKRRLDTSVENRRLKTQLIQRYEGAPTRAHYPDEEGKALGPSRVRMSFQRLPQRRDLLIYQEIIDKPKSLRPW